MYCPNKIKGKNVNKIRCFINYFLSNLRKISNNVLHFSPSIAAEIIPPAYPAPSPHGYKPLI